MYIVPNSDVILLEDVQIDNTYVHSIYFQDEVAQYIHFSTEYNKRVFPNYSYQRVRKNRIRVQGNAEDLQTVNYMLFRNTAYGTKWFYAFVISSNYINDNTTEIIYEIDVIQTYMFETVFRPSFVEREHVDNDRIGLHTFPENLETGEYRVANSIDNELFSYRSQNEFVIMGASDNISKYFFDDGEISVDGTDYNGIASGLTYFAFYTNQIYKAIDIITDGGGKDAIVSLFVGVNGVNTISWTGTDKNITIGLVSHSTSAKVFEWEETQISGLSQQSIYKPTSLLGYVPKNKKLLTYPYVYLNMSNNSGANAIYHYEKFTDTAETSKGIRCSFQIQCAITPSYSIRIVPRLYNGVAINKEEGLNLGKFPLCNWTTDQFSNWLAYNTVNIALKTGADILKTVGGAVVGRPDVSAFGVSGVLNSISSIYEHSLVPRQVEGNTNNGNVVYSNKDLTFTAYQMSIKSEYAEIIDNFFDKYGYKVNVVKVPNKNHRERWWYTKTIDASIYGSIPNDFLNKIKMCYNNGITFWTNGKQIGRYDLSNNIVERGN